MLTAKNWCPPQVADVLSQLPADVDVEGMVAATIASTFGTRAASAFAMNGYYPATTIDNT